MSQSEQQLTSEEREALPGFAAPIPRRVQKKADERHNPWGWLQGNKPFFLLVFRVACAFGVLSFFLGNFLGIVVWLTGCFVLGVGFAILILPQSLQGHFWHRALARTGIAVMGVVTERDGVKEIRRGPGLVEVIYFTHAYQFQTQAGETVTGVWSGQLKKVQVGDPILIVYHPRNPRKHLLFRDLNFEPIAPEIC